MLKTKVSPRQLMVVASGFSFGSVSSLLPSVMAKLAGPDAWLSMLLGTIVGLLFIWIYAKLGELNPNKTLIETIQLYFGKVFGGILSAFLILAVLVQAAQLTWFFGDFVRNEFRPGLPIFFMMAIFIAVLVLALSFGVETMYRASELIFAFLFPLFIVANLMLIPKMRVENLMPIMEKGVYPVLKGSIPFMTYCVWPLALLNMVYPVCFENVKEAKKALFKGYLLGTIVAIVAVLACIMVVGSNLLSNMSFPMYMVNREIDFLVVFSRLEAVTVCVSIGVSLIAAFCYSYAGIFGLSQILKLKNYKILVLPIGLLLVLYTPFIYENTNYELKWDMMTWPPLSFTLGFILPVALLILSLIKKKREKNSSKIKNTP